MEQPSSAFSTGVPALTAIPQPAGNSRQGFGLQASTSCLGSGFSISSNTLGLSTSLYDSDAGSRSTGKERDTESGNDYFGARYYASNMGRWMSPDWAAKAIPVPYAKLDNPQTLNLYAYVGNNPLSRRDPDGHYQCSGSKDQCAAIKGALDVVRKADANLKEGSKERTRLDKVLSFYGAEGQKNGVNVNFGKLDGAVGQTGTSSFFGFFKTTTITFDSGAISKFADAGKGETVAHEGTHGVDQREGETGTNPYARAFYGEVHAYQSESYVDQGLGVRTESDGNNPVWAPGMSGDQSAEAIRQNAKANADQDCKGGGCNP